MSESPSPSAATSDPSTEVGRQELRHWRAVFSLGSKESEDRFVLQERLADWSSRHGDVPIAFYRRCGQGLAWTRWLVVGGDRLPAEVPGSGALPGMTRWILPECLVLLASDEIQRPDREILLISAGIRIAALKQELNEHSFQAKFRGVELEALYDVGLSIASTLDLEELSEGILLHSVSLLDARRGALYLIEGDCFVLASTIGGQARDRSSVAEVDVEAIRSGSCADLEGWLPETDHLLVVPVEVDGALRGLLIVADKESRRGVGPFPPTDRRTLGLFANQAAIALENAKLHRLALEKERLEREMELAAEIQQQILPKRIPEFDRLEVRGWNRPARQVGGDYFHLLGDREHPSFVVGDVTGKGLPAALLVSTLHSALSLLLDQLDVGPEVIARLNHHVYESSSLNKFITLIAATVDEEGRRLHYVNAGHNPGIVAKADGTVLQLDSGGLPLGLLPDATYEGVTIDLEPGDLVCLYSDGITECEAPDEEQYELDRLTQLLQSRREEPLDEILRAIDVAVTEFAQGQPQGDDQTVVLLRPR